MNDILFRFIFCGYMTCSAVWLLIGNYNHRNCVAWASLNVFFWPIFMAANFISNKIKKLNKIH